MISFVDTENCVKWHMDTCLSVQNKQKEEVPLGGVHNTHLENSCIFKAHVC